MIEREPAITDMIELVQEADQKFREMTVEDAKKKKSQRSKARRRGFRRALRRALKR